MTKLTRSNAVAQAKRLQSSPMLAPQSDEGRKEIVDCLMRHCTDVEHAARTITAVLDGCRDPRNLTAEIAAAATETREGLVLPDGCEECRYIDAQTGETKYRAHVPGEHNGYSVAVRCSCKRGQWLSRRDRERESQAQRETAPGKRDFAKLAAGDQDE